MGIPFKAWGLETEPVIYQLIYVSDVVAERAGDLDGILSGARSFNEKVGVTGALWFNGINFIQILEGARDPINEVYGRINRSSSHRNIELCWMSPCEGRFFQGWSMAYLSPFHNTPALDGWWTDVHNPHAMDAMHLREVILKWEIDRQSNTLASV